MGKIDFQFVKALLRLDVMLMAFLFAFSSPLSGQTGCDGQPILVGCIANVNVTLNGSCAATITPSMVLTGNFQCADQIVVTVDGGNSNVMTGCGTHTYMVVVTDNGQEVYTCWGNILAEDKTDPVLVCPANTDEVTVQLSAQVISGALAATDPSIQLTNYSCFLEIFPPLAGNHFYDLYTFTANDPTGQGIFTFDMGSAWGDGTMALFQGSFNPANPCENIIAQADDLISGSGFFASFDPTIRMSAGLVNGQTYTLMVSSWANNQTGNYGVAVFGENGASISGGFPTQTAPVTFDLVCTDIDQIRLTAPATYVVNAAGGIVSISSGLSTILNRTGFPTVTDNCGSILVTVSDVVSSAGDCGIVTLTRTFRAADRYNSSCTGTPRVVTCQQIITFRKPVIAEVILPNFTAVIECDENFPTDGSVGGPDNNPAASVTGYPFIRTAFGFHDLNSSYCNIGASYSDEPRINVCQGSYKLRRQWNIIDWCNPSSSVTYNQLVKVGDFTGPVLTGIPAVISASTSPFSCLANYSVPTPVITDGNGCSNVFPTTYTVLANGTTFFAGGTYQLVNGVYRANPALVAVPIGQHKLVICAKDGCGNETCVTYDLIVRDLIEPSAACDDQLNVSIGGGDVASGITGIARIFATDVNEGSNDNCGPVTLEVRRNYWRNNTCDPSASRWSAWGAYVDFYCCDINNQITIELRVTDQSGNQNVCWMYVTPEDKLNPFCYAPANVSLTCSNLPLAFPGDIANAYNTDFAATSVMMNAIFGGATGTDNCAVDTIVERTPNIQVNDCGWGSITRRFEAWQLRPAGDANGNGAIDINEVFRSTNSCSQLITITEVHDFTIDFPEDTDADCGDPEIPTIITSTVGCDVLSVNIGTPVRYSSTGDECYKMSITYDVINWCVWDGEYIGLTLPRMTEDDGEALPIDRSVEGNERPVVRVVSGFGPVDNDCNNVADAQQGIQYTVVIDRNHNDRNGNSSIPNLVYDNIPGNNNACIPADQFGRRNYGRYKYTQFIKVYDSTAPVISVGNYGGPTALCPTLAPRQFGSVTGTCGAPVSIPFSVADDCELFNQSGNLVVTIVSASLDAFAVDANRDGFIKSNEFVADANAISNITNNGDGTFVFTGTFPIITTAMGDNILHAFRVLFQDGCGNQVSKIIEFDVIDCKGPAPICINGLTVTLMPQEGGGCAMAIWASDFEASPIYDCTGQGPAVHPTTGLPRVTKYAIYRAADVEANPNFVPSPNDTGLVLTDEDEQTTVVYVYAFDQEGNYDYCETYILVQQHVSCNPVGNGTIQGVIATENSVNVQGVEVSVNGGTQSMVTNTNGTFTFSLPQGGDYSITPYLNANPLNGVSTFDLVLMAKHILGVQALNSPYKMIAADINRSGSISTLDMIQLRKLILNIETSFANNTSWRFIPVTHTFPLPTNPWFAAFPELRNVNDLVGTVNANFVAVKIGDVNGSAQANALVGDDRTMNGQFNLVAENQSLKAGNEYTVAFTAADLAAVTGFQGTLKLQGANLISVENGVATAENFGLRFAQEGFITMSWNRTNYNEATAKDEVLFSLVIQATTDAQLSDILTVTSRYTAAEAYSNGNTMNVGLTFSGSRDALQSVFTLFQNMPNPFQAETLIGFNLPKEAKVQLTISDLSGRVLYTNTGANTVLGAGYQTITVTKQMINGATGVLNYTIEAGDYRATKQMVVVK
jgi:hypothetical protein